MSAERSPAQQQPQSQQWLSPPQQHGDGEGSAGAATNAAAGATAAPRLPRWVEEDRRVLRFYGYFKEAVAESPAENHRARRVVVCYHLADGTLQVTEPKQDNSGIAQGVFVRRHQVPRDGGGAGSTGAGGAGAAGVIGPDDLRVGAAVVVYGRALQLVDADAFTRAWYEANARAPQAPASVYPADPVDAHRAKFGLTGAAAAQPPAKRGNDLATFAEARLGKPSHLIGGDRLGQFLAHSGRVLRFWCAWDARGAMYGDRRPYVLHYYLEDDSVEINEARAAALSAYRLAGLLTLLHWLRGREGARD